MKAVNKAEDKETHSAHLPGAEFPPALVGEARNLHQVWWARRWNLHQVWWARHEISTSFGGQGAEISTKFGGGGAETPPALVGEARNLHQFWWARHEISNSHGDRPQKNKPPGYRHCGMTSRTQSCAALKSPFPQAIIKCVIVFPATGGFHRQASRMSDNVRR